MSHYHIHNNTEVHVSKNLFISFILNILITTVEIIGGIVSNSVALLSDSFHNLSDSAALLIAFFANRVSGKKSTYKRTFGYKRIEILAAFINSLVLIVICIFLFIEAYRRFINPEPIKGGLMLVVAIIGLIANFISILLLKRDSQQNINIKAAYLHLLGDTFSSIAVIVGAILIYYFGILWIDAIISFIIGIYIIKETISILKQAIDILMQSVPEGIDLFLIKRELEKINGIINIHHIHIWSLDDRSIYFECHIDLDKDYRITELEGIRQNIMKQLKDIYNIEHITLQFEYGGCCKNEIIAEG
jgi:cobalt-zinc-cadmium efflux system protein